MTFEFPENKLVDVMEFIYDRVGAVVTDFWIDENRVTLRTTPIPEILSELDDAEFTYTAYNLEQIVIHNENVSN